MTEEYLFLFNAISKTIEQLEKTLQDLRSYQSQAEEIYLARTD